MAAEGDREADGLRGIRVLVTRPADQAQSLCELIAARGGHPLHIPALEIQPPRDPAPAREVVARLAQFDMAIFVSRNAIRCAHQLVGEAGGWPAGLRLAVVGRGSADALAACGLEAHIRPAEAFNSEALLALEEMWDVAGKRIVIFRGEGGRELLAKTLRERGATVEYAEVYRRAMPEAAAEQLQHALSKNCIDIVTVTSNEGLQNLLRMAGPRERRLLRLPLVVISQRTALLAARLGFSQGPVIAHESSDQGLVAAMEAWYAVNHNERSRRVIHE
ncbi:MAG TPA: uroporphyrinogen-III synthase [Gammaproteobacteria bacterium]|nr:uroporphyrinogen-III synthase [Gammaproteobacteria bacterium]